MSLLKETDVNKLPATPPVYKHAVSSPNLILSRTQSEQVTEVKQEDEQWEADEESQLREKFESIFANDGKIDHATFIEVVTPLLDDEFFHSCSPNKESQAYSGESKEVERRENEQALTYIKAAFESAKEDPSATELTFPQCVQAIQTLGLGLKKNAQDNSENEGSSARSEQGGIEGSDSFKFTPHGRSFTARGSKVDKLIEMFHDSRPQDLKLTLKQAKELVVTLSRRCIMIESEMGAKLEEKDKLHAEELEEYFRQLRNEWDLVFEKLNHHKSELNMEMATLNDAKLRQERDWDEERKKSERLLDRLRIESRELLKQKLALESKIPELTEQIEVLSQEIIKERSTSQILENSVRKFEKLLLNEKESSLQLTTQVKNWERKNGEMKKTIMILEDRVEEAEMRSKEFEMNCEVLDKDIAVLRSQRDADIEWLERSSPNISNQSAPYLRTSGSRRSYSSEGLKTMNLEAEVAALKAQELQDELELQLVEEKTTVENLRIEMKAELENHHKSAREARDKLLEEKRIAEIALREKLSQEHGTELVRLRLEHQSELDNAITEHQMTMERTKAQHAKIVKDLEATNQEIEAKWGKDRELIERMKNEQNEADGKIKLLTEEQTSLREQIRLLKQQLQKIMKERESSIREISEKDDLLEKSRQRSVKLEEQLKSLRADNEERLRKKTETGLQRSVTVSPLITSFAPIESSSMPQLWLSQNSNSAKRVQTGKRLTENVRKFSYIDDAKDEAGRNYAAIQARLQEQTRKFFVEREKINQTKRMDIAAFVPLLVKRRSIRRQRFGHEETPTKPLYRAKTYNKISTKYPPKKIDKFLPESVKSQGFKRLVPGPPPLPQHFIDSTSSQYSEGRRRSRKSKRKKKKPPPLPTSAAIPNSIRGEPQRIQLKAEKPNTLISPFISNSWPLRNFVSSIPETKKMNEGNRLLEHKPRLKSGAHKRVSSYPTVKVSEISDGEERGNKSCATM